MLKDKEQKTLGGAGGGRNDKKQKKEERVAKMGGGYIKRENKFLFYFCGNFA